MNANAIIDTLITNYDHVDPDDGEYAQRRIDYLGFLRQVYAYCNGIRDFDWRYKEGTPIVVAPSANSAALPADFYKWGAHGQLNASDGSTRYYPKPKWFVEQLRRSGASRVSRFFAVWQRSIQLTYTVTGAGLTLIPYYVATEAVEDTATELLMPDHWLDLVVIPAVVYKRQVNVADGRVELWTGELKDGLAEMCGSENPMNGTVSRIPRIYPGRR